MIEHMHTSNGVHTDISEQLAEVPSFIIWVLGIVLRLSDCMASIYHLTHLTGP